MAMVSHNAKPRKQKSEVGALVSIQSAGSPCLLAPPSAPPPCLPPLKCHDLLETLMAGSTWYQTTEDATVYSWNLRVQLDDGSLQVCSCKLWLPDEVY